MELATESRQPIAGPRSLGAVNAIAIGTWTQIVSITAPSEAAYGQTVNIQVRVKNLAAYGIYIALTAQYDGVDIPISPDYAGVDAGATSTFTGAFTMPNKDVRLTVWSFFWTDSEWWEDDSKHVDIALAAVWAKLATRGVTITPEVVAWQKLTTQAVTITPEILWQKLTTQAVTITPEILWQKLATQGVTITPVDIAWKKLTSKAITVTPEAVPYELIEETIYPYAYIYEGPHDGGTFTFKTDPLTPASWVAGRLARHVEDEVRKAGGRMLEMRVYVDKSPLFWSDWRIEVITAPPTTTGTAMPLGIVWWGVAILLALAIVLIIVITWSVLKVYDAIFKRKPGLDEVKVGWGKETLISTIQDSEEYWERTPTPVETLQGMSEEELRHLLNQIAEEEVPPAEPGAGLAFAAIGVLGLGALALGAYAMSRPKETGTPKR